MYVKSQLFASMYTIGRKLAGAKLMSLMTLEKMQAIIEAALMVADHPLTVASLQNLFNEEERPSTAEVKSILGLLKDRHNSESSGVELRK